MYKNLLDIAVENLSKTNAITRVVPQQNRQVKHYQTFLMTNGQMAEFKEKKESKTIYAIDFVIKYSPDDIHDTGHYIFIMFQGEKIFERKRKTIFDFGFYKILRDFEAAHRAISKHYADEKRALLFEKIGG
jgi:hypothetical protein